LRSVILVRENLFENSFHFFPPFRFFQHDVFFKVR
jgi:hypothetical protein